MKIKSYIALPALLTALNIFFGFYAIIQVFEQHFTTAAFLIFFAGIFDALDGRVARLFGTTSQFGLQMDSLGDVVSAGVAPAVLVYFVYLHGLGFFGLIVSFLPLVFSAVRLARFNIFIGGRTRDNCFIGLPAPMASLTFGSIVLLYEGTGYRPLLQLLPLAVPMVIHYLQTIHHITNCQEAE